MQLSEINIGDELYIKESQKLHPDLPTPITAGFRARVIEKNDVFVNVSIPGWNSPILIHPSNLTRKTW